MSREESSPSGRSDDPERNELHLAWKREARDATTKSERAFRGWELLRENGVDLLAIRETGEVYACHGGVWRADGEQVLREKARQMMASEYSTAVFRELREQVRTTSSIPTDELGTPRGTAAVGNGLLDLRDRSLRELRPEDHALSRYPVDYESGASCPRWRTFLDSVVGDESGRSQLQEFVGYCLAGGDPWLKKALMIFGPTDAGKTVFLDIVERLFGEEANAAQTPQYLANQRWGVHQLAGNPVNIRHDVDAERLQTLGVLKEVIDGNPVTAEQKGKNPYTFRPQTRHLFAANRAPKRPVDDEAFWNRWLTVTFPDSVPPEEQDPKPKLLGELTGELPGILNWALDGLDRLRGKGEFTDAPTPDENRRRWEQYGTPIERFKSVCLDKEPGEWVRKDIVRSALADFCADRGHEQPSNQKLSRVLLNDPEIGKTQKRVDGGKPRVYTGIRLSEGCPHWIGGETIVSDSR